MPSMAESESDDEEKEKVIDVRRIERRILPIGDWGTNVAGEKWVNV
jgi:hypothetical protein